MTYLDLGNEVYVSIIPVQLCVKIRDYNRPKPLNFVRIQPYDWTEIMAQLSQWAMLRAPQFLYQSPELIVQLARGGRVTFFTADGQLTLKKRQFGIMANNHIGISGRLLAAVRSHPARR